MEGTIYILCGILAGACAILLLRGYRRSSIPLLLWTSLFFFVLTVENFMLFVDRIVLPDTDLTVIMDSLPLLGVFVLMYGLVWEN